MTDPITIAIRQRNTVTLFDPERGLSDLEIVDLIELATRAPSSFNIQNWRFIAVRTPEAKARLRPIAWDQQKITESAVTFIMVGVLADHRTVPARLAPAVAAGIMPEEVADGWQGAAEKLYADHAWRARDEAVRSATFAASHLILAAHARGLGAGPMIGFEDDAVRREFGLADNEIPVMLVSVGYPTERNWPQKPRRPVPEILDLV